MGKKRGWLAAGLALAALIFLLTAETAFAKYQCGLRIPIPPLRAGAGG